MDRETGRFADAIASSIDRVVGCLEGVDRESARWQPLPTANSLLSIANHVLANAERNVLGTYCGQPYDWRRDEEFLAPGVTPGLIRESWADLKTRMMLALESCPPDDLVRSRTHPRLGDVPGREVLLQAARHAAEHVGEAELTRALLLARE